MKSFVILSLAMNLTLNAACPNDEDCLMCLGTTCVAGYCDGTYRNDSGVCTAPTTKISNCVNYASATTCAECNVGYYLKTTTECAAITLTGCAVSDNNTYCTMCSNSKQTTTSGTCSTTACTTANCKYCTLDVCVVCNDGYTLSTNGTSTVCTKD